MNSHSRSSVALVPYWLKDDPRILGQTDHSWWFDPLVYYDVIVYAGPYLSDTAWYDESKKKISLATQSHSWHINEILPRLLEHGLSLSDFTLVWNVLEASATCRTYGLESIEAVKIAVIGDTHHLCSPITSLLTYLQNNSHTYLFTTHNQHAPFFGACLQIPAKGWPFPCAPDKQVINHSRLLTEEIIYYGNTRSLHHRHRSRTVNYALLHDDVKVVPRLPFCDWLDRVGKGGQAILGCSLNGSPSFQTYYSLLSANLLISDPIAPSSWLGRLISMHQLCLTYRDKEDCIRIIKFLMRASGSPQSMRRLQAMADLAGRVIGECVNCPREYGLAFLHPENGFTSLKGTTTDHDVQLLQQLCFIRTLLGLEYLLLIIKMFEILQEQHRLFWDVTLVLNETFMHDAEVDFWTKINLLLPRVTVIRSLAGAPFCADPRSFCYALVTDLKTVALGSVN